MCNFAMSNEGNSSQTKQDEENRVPNSMSCKSFK